MGRSEHFTMGAVPYHDMVKAAHHESMSELALRVYSDTSKKMRGKLGVDDYQKLNDLEYNISYHSDLANKTLGNAAESSSKISTGRGKIAGSDKGFAVRTTRNPFTYVNRPRYSSEKGKGAFHEWQ